MSPEEQENIQVRESVGKISFKWKSTLGTSFQIAVNIPPLEQFSLLTIKEKASTQTNPSNVIHKKECLEKVATLTNNVALTIVTHGILLTDDNCQYAYSNRRN